MNQSAAVSQMAPEEVEFDGATTAVPSSATRPEKNDIDHPGSDLDPPAEEPINRGWAIGYRRCLFATDFIIIVGVVFASQTLRFDDPSVALDMIFPLTYWGMSCGLAAGWMAAMALAGAWDTDTVGVAANETRAISQGSVHLFGLIAIVSFLLHLQVARGYLALALPLGVAGIICGRWVWRMLLVEQRRAGTHMDTVLVVGGRQSALELAVRLRTNPQFGYRVTGLCFPSDQPLTGKNMLDGFVVAGDWQHIPAAVRRVGASVVAVSASEHFGSSRVQRLAWDLEGSGIRLAVAPSLVDVAGPRIHIRPVAGLPLMHVDEPSYRGLKLLTKTVLDLTIALAALVIFAPVLVVAAAAVKFHDGGPVFFRHQRVGLAGRTFRVWKFRSMRVGSDRTFQEVKALVGQSDSVFFKAVDDPRITRVGRLLRRTSIDELPQLFNVLAGQMSIVGPRPLVPGEGAGVGSYVERRMLVKPGITGLWQVSGRSAVSEDERVRLDLYYVENWMITSDLAIIGKTVITVLSGKGAY